MKKIMRKNRRNNISWSKEGGKVQGIGKKKNGGRKKISCQGRRGRRE
jgi:hypothetical protein